MIEAVWMIGLLVALAAGLWLVIGSQRGAAGVQTRDRSKLNADAFVRQRDVLKARLDDAELTNEQHAEALAQLEQTFAAEMRTAEKVDKPLRNTPWPLWQKLVLCLLPVVITAVSFQISNGAQHFVPSPSGDEEQPSLEELVAALQARLQEQPDDPRGWMMLGRSYGVMGRHAQAAEAYGRANALTDESNPDLLVAQAEALGMANDQRLDGASLTLIDKALALDAQHLRGLWYALLAAAQRGDDVAQTQYLERLSQLPDLPNEMAQWLEAEFGVNIASTNSGTSENGMSFEINVAIAPEIQAQLPEGATLFVFARAAEGPPMPLAVSRQALPSQWPVRVTLNDSMSMLEDMNLSSFDAWVVVARISASGQAQAQAGDWQASIPVNAPLQGPLELTITEQLP